MAGPTLGTLLIQRLDAALGTTLSQQTQIVNRASADPVTHPERPARPEHLTNTLARDSRSNIDRTTLGARSGVRVDGQPSTGDATSAGRMAGSAVTTSATTTLGLAARIILNLFADPAATRAAAHARAPLLDHAPGQGTSSALGTRTAGAISGSAAGATASSSATPLANTGAMPGTPPQGLSQVLSQALSQSLQQSGLFYESHLRGLLTGQYRLADIMQEPQARLGRSPGSGGAHTAGAQPGSQGPASGPNTPATASGSSTGTAVAGTAAAPGGTGAPAPGMASETVLTGTGLTNQPTPSAAFTPGVDPTTHSLVRQQLETLAEQSIQWRGEAWPGASMEWQVKRHTDEHHPKKPDTDDDPPWQSDIRLQLPRLGDISINIRLAGNQVSVSLQADESITPYLREHAGALRDQMRDRRLELTAITFVEPDPATPDISTSSPDRDEEDA